jgi:hypothetical protein
VSVTPEVRRQTAEWLAGVEGESARARVLYERINDWVREPRAAGTATETLVLRAGNRLRLYLAMLEAAGIEHRFACARRSPEVDLEDPRWDWLREDLFPNPLVQVRPDDGPPVWVVLAARAQPYGTIPARLYGSPVFVVDDDEGTIDYLPLAPTDEDIRLVSEVDLTPVGFGFEATIRLRIPAAQSGFWKDTLRTLTATQKRQMGLSLVQSFAPGTRMDEVRFEGVEEPGEPVTIEAKVTSESVQMQSGQNLMALRLGFPLLNLVGRFATPGERTHPFLFENFDYRTDRMRLHLGSEYRAVTIPPDLAIDRYLGPYRLEARYTRDGVEIVREVAFGPVKIAPEEYPRFMEFCRRIDDLEAERIWILPLFEPPQQPAEEEAKKEEREGDR